MQIRIRQLAQRVRVDLFLRERGNVLSQPEVSQKVADAPGGVVSVRAVRDCRSTGGSVACSAGLAAFRNLAACLLAAMLADISRDRLAFLKALRCLAASLLATIRAS